MGEFDRHAQPQERTQNKQIVTAITLIVILIVVLGYHFMKPGPRTASAAVPAASGAPTPEPPPDQVAQSLLQDPTARLLLEDPRNDRAFAEVPRNPFILANTWKDTLVHAEAPVVARPTTPGRPAPATLQADDFRLSSIIRVNDRLSAIVNGHIVSAGMIVDGARILEIRPDRVIIQSARSAEGPTVELAIDPKLK
jgi:hypothetical protein